MEIAVENLCVKLGKKSILTRLYFSIPSGSFVAILGPNGAGKSTLLRAVAGFIKFDGKLLVNSKKSKGLISEKNAMSYVPQNLSIPMGMTVGEYVMLGRTKQSNWFFGEREKDYKAVIKALETLDLASKSTQLVTTLSGGEMQRATLARALAQGAEVLLLDEPIAAMDFARIIDSLKVLNKIRTNYKLTILMATHDINSLSRYADFALVLKHGQNLYSGEFSGIIEKNFLENLYDTKIEFLKNKEGYSMIFANPSTS